MYFVVYDVASAMDNIFRGDCRTGNDVEFSNKCVLTDENEMTASRAISTCEHKNGAVSKESSEIMRDSPVPYFSVFFITVRSPLVITASNAGNHSGVSVFV